MTRLILAMFFSLSLPHLAAAHSPLLSSSPADGEAVAAAIRDVFGDGTSHAEGALEP